MSRCLSTRALMRVLADLATDGERAHLATCSACAARHLRLTGDVEAVAHVLTTTSEPRAHTAPAARRWVPAAVALSVIGVGALVWIEVAAWRIIRSVPDPVQGREVAEVLEDLSSSLFSASGEPTRGLSERLIVALERHDVADVGCDDPERLEDAECAEAPSAVEASFDLIEMEPSPNAEQGGSP